VLEVARFVDSSLINHNIWHLQNH